MGHHDLAPRMQDMPPHRELNQCFATNRLLARRST